MDELISHINNPPIRRIFIFIVNLISFIIGDILFGWTSPLKTKTIQIESEDFSLTGINHLKAIQISDIHWNFPSEIKRIRSKTLQRVINICNKEKPDIVFITGLLIDLSDL